MQRRFEWPKGKRAAVSLSFDDARVSQIDRGMEILDRHGVKATFYVSCGAVEQRLEGWKTAVMRGHEIGNHTLTHPCSGNFSFSRNNALEEFTLGKMEADILGANERIGQLLGVKPVTFAYPCGQTYVGRGVGLSSYIPIVAKHFLVGRSAYDEVHNFPLGMDLAQAFAIDADCAAWEKIKSFIDLAATEGGWAIFFAHDVGEGQRQMMRADVLDQVCRYCGEAANGVWIDTVANVGRYVKSQE
jgi:peptidoglycan/xylan/chitin deacetylase (PgdA/CDA1 family)